MAQEFLLIMGDWLANPLFKQSSKRKKTGHQISIFSKKLLNRGGTHGSLSRRNQR
jgi:hypothetical protein